MNKTLALPPLTKKGILAAAVVAGGVALDSMLAPGLIRIPAAYPVLLMFLAAIGVAAVIDPLLKWNSMGTLQTPYDGNFSLARIETVKSALPLLVIGANSLNVPMVGFATKPKDFIVTPPGYVERFHRNLLLHGRLYPVPRRDFSDFPEIAEALEQAEYKASNPEHQIHLAVWGTLAPDDTVKTLDLRAFEAETVKDLDEAKQLSRDTAAEVARAANMYRKTKRGSL